MEQCSPPSMCSSDVTTCSPPPLLFYTVACVLLPVRALNSLGSGAGPHLQSIKCRAHDFAGLVKKGMDAPGHESPWCSHMKHLRPSTATPGSLQMIPALAFESLLPFLQQGGRARLPMNPRKVSNVAGQRASLPSFWT